MSRTAAFRRRRTHRISFAELRLAVLLGLALGVAAAAGFDSAEVPRFEFPSSHRGEAVAQRFTICAGARSDDCVVDGDTFRMAGSKIRIADIDTPETHPPRCAEEAALGDRATRRLADLLSAGPFTLEPADRDTDRYGRKLRIVTRRGESIGDLLVDEGLARPWQGRRRPWCDTLA